MAVGPLGLPAEALRGSELGAAGVIDWELVVSMQKSWPRGNLGTGNRGLGHFSSPGGRRPACVCRREAPSPGSGSRARPHTVTSCQAAGKSSGDQHSLLGCGS